MEKQAKVKSRRKYINPVFHLQTKAEDEKFITKDVIKNVRKTGQLNLFGRHLSSVPEGIFTMYELTDGIAVNVDFNRASKDDEEVWWNMKPLTNLDLSSNVLTNIPEKISMFQDLTVLNLQDNNLTTLPPELGNLTKLTKLSINHNKINNLPKEFYKLTELKNLSISDNCLDNVSKDIADLVMLEKLDISNNAIPKLPSGIGFLVRLIDLNVANNKLTDVPPDIVNLRNLLKLDISHNSIKHLPDMGELRKLQLLYAQHNDIEEIPEFLGCGQVEEVYFGNNFIKDIPIEFCENLVHLKVLELRDNQIELVPNEITNLAHLTKLDLTNNDISELPNTIGLMPHLQSLKIEGNKLKQIRPDIIHTGTNRILRHLREKISDEEMQGICGKNLVSTPGDNVFPDRYSMRNGNILNLALKNLSDVPDSCFEEAKEAKVTIVDLCKNKFTKVPEGLVLVAGYLTELNLSVNQLKELPDFVKDCKKLKFCDFSKNLLSTLPSSFVDMVSLRELILCNNKLTNVPDCVYGMVGLEILLLNDNGIEEINVEGLKKLKRLASLNLCNNNIHHVPPELGNMTQLSLELKGNPFRQPRYAILEQGTDSILAYLRDKIPL
ncbi:leucine-rich repeat-containing protein 40 isoform X2 [Anoplophora glabripennis]|uniref:leucine-rich repeat-containing protein 40 isoform X2 n=1 Tax=Anoplophora glabripennis TaxID=217634 RepID=UPI0008756812|nr:leucine-rich repeat-containing protein 40 isoform X2 [Anoplophora glabripennis]